MRKIIFFAALTAIFFSSCSDQSMELIESEIAESEPFLKAAATGITVSAYADRSSYINTGFKFLNPSQVNLNRTARGGNAYTSVYGFNIPENNRARGILWSDNNSTDDERTPFWRPQGITGFTKDGVRYLLVSWYGRDAKEHNGARITLMDISPSSPNYLKYRHIILVQNVLPSTTPTKYTQYSTFAPISLHAGGIAYVKGKIFIASTSLGIRVFDINKIIEVSTSTGSGSKCGKDANGKSYAFGYKYILPQVGFYRINGGANPFSGLQINAEGTQIWTCQYYAGSAASSIVPKIYGFPIDSDGKLVNSGIQVITPKNSLFAGNHAHGMQGVFRKGKRTWISCTGSPSLSYGSTARLARYTDGADNTVRYRWPHGSEGLYYESKYDYLWCLTEFEPNAGSNNGSSINRCIYAVKFANYE